MARLYVLFAAVYLLEGITEVSFILNVYLSKVLEFTPTQVAQTLFLGGMWFILLKPVLGFIADFWRRFNVRVALAAGLVCSAGGWWLISQAQTQTAMIVGVSLKVVAIALLDVLIDGMIVSVSSAKNRSLIQSIVYGARFGGGMLCANWAGGMISESAAAFTQIYYVFSLASLAVLLPVFLYKRSIVEAQREQGRQEAEPASAGAAPVTFGERLKQIRTPSFFWLILLLFLFSFGVDTSTFYDPILEARFSGEFLGAITTAYYIGILAGIAAFPLFRRRFGMKALFVLSLIGWSLVEISCLGIREWNGHALYFCGGFFNAWSSLVLLTVATALCKIQGIETFAFAFAISFKNLMDQSKVLFGGYVMEWSGIEWLFVISATCGLLPFIVMHKLEFKEV